MWDYLPKIAVTPFSMLLQTFFDVRNESVESGTYWMSYTSVVFGNILRSLLILYTAYLNANSMLVSFCSSLNIAPVATKPGMREIFLWKK